MTGMAMVILTAVFACGCGKQGAEVQDRIQEEGQAAGRGQTENTDGTAGDSQMWESTETAGNSQTADKGQAAEESADAGSVPERESPESRKKKEMFGEDCIADQCFEVALNRCEGTVYFVPYAPSAEQPELRMQMVRDGEVLCSITPYVPAKAMWKSFTSLDAVSFWDVNFDGFTDVVTITTYGDTQTAAVYYGDMFGYEEEYWSFFSEEELSDYLSGHVEMPMTIGEIRELLTGGKKNGEFGSYVEAYEAAVNLSVMEGLSDSVTKYDADQAGLIMNTYFMRINEHNEIETPMWIKSINYIDSNGNGQLDEDEEFGAGPVYINGEKASLEEMDAVYDAYDMGDYQPIRGRITEAEVRSALKE